MEPSFGLALAAFIAGFAGAAGWATFNAIISALSRNRP